MIVVGFSATRGYTDGYLPWTEEHDPNNVESSAKGLSIVERDEQGRVTKGTLYPWHRIDFVQEEVTYDD